MKKKLSLSAFSCLIMLIPLISCNVRKIELSDSLNKCSVEIESYGINMQNENYLSHIYLINKSSKNSFSDTKENTRILEVNNLEAGYYDIYCYIFKNKSENELFINNALIIENFLLTKNEKIKNVIPEVKPDIKIFHKENNITLTFDFSNLEKMIYISSLTMKTEDNKFLKYTAISSDKKIITAYFENIKAAKPETINVSYANRGKYDKEYFSGRNIKITTKRIENLEIRHSEK